MPKRTRIQERLGCAAQSEFCSFKPLSILVHSKLSAETVSRKAECLNSSSPGNEIFEGSAVSFTGKLMVWQCLSDSYLVILVFSSVKLVSVFAEPELEMRVESAAADAESDSARPERLRLSLLLLAERFSVIDRSLIILFIELIDGRFFSVQVPSACNLIKSNHKNIS